MASYSLTESVEVNGVTRANKGSAGVFLNPVKNEVSNLTYSLKSNVGSYKVENAEKKDVHFVCVETTKGTQNSVDSGVVKWVTSTTVVPAEVEKIELDFVDNIVGVKHVPASCKDKKQLIKVEKPRAKKNSRNELMPGPPEGRRSSRSSGRSSDRSVKKQESDNRSYERVAMQEQSSSTSSVVMWRELEEELKKLNEMVEEDRPKEAERQARKDARKQSGANLISRSSKNDMPMCRKRGSSTYVGGKTPKRNEVSLAYIDSESDTLSLQSSVKTDTCFSEEEETRRRRRVDKQVHPSTDGGLLQQKVQYPRSHSGMPQTLQTPSTLKRP